MAEHTELGGSVAKRFWNCPGSVLLSRGVPNSESAAAHEGTVAHRLAELCLTSGQDAEEYTGRTVLDTEIVAEMATGVQVYLDECRRVDVLPANRWVERRVDLAALQPPAPMFGTADFMAYVPGWKQLRVIDLKYGRRVQVEAIGNEQLWYYALGALLSLPAGTVVREIEAVIVQPRAPGGPAIRRAMIEPIELMEWSIELLDHAARAMQPNAALHAGEWCRFCPVRGSCGERAAAALAVAQIEFGSLDQPRQDWLGGKCPVCLGTGTVPSDTNTSGEARCDDCGGTGDRFGPVPTAPADIRLMQPEQVAAALHLAPALLQWVTDLRRSAHADIQAGKQIPGWKLVSGKATRRWEEPAYVADALGDEGIPDSVIFAPPEPRSPAQLETALAAILRPSHKTVKAAMLDAKAVLAPLIVTTISGSNLAPEIDPRQALPPGGSEFTTFEDT